MAQDTSNASFALKTVFAPSMRNAINNSDPTETEFQRRFDREDFEGDNFVWSLHTKRSNSTRAIPEGGKTPAAGRQGGAKPQQATYEVVSTIKVSRKVIKASRSNRGSFRRVLELETSGAESDSKNNVCRQNYGRGVVQTGSETVLRTGVIAFVAGAPSANVITLDDGAGNALTAAEMRYFFVDMTVSAVDPADGSVDEAGMVITAVDPAASTITVDDDGATADNDWIVLGDSAGSAYNAEYPGLRVLLNSATGDKIDGTNTVLVHNVSSATNPAWATPTLSSAAISEKHLQDSYTKIMTDGNGEPGESIVLGSYEQQDALANKLIAQRRYESRETKLPTGWDGLKLSHGVFIPTRYCPTNLAWRINPQDMAIVENSPFEWDEEDGDVLFKTSDELNYEARWVGDRSLAALSRNSHCRIPLAAV